MWIIIRQAATSAWHISCSKDRKSGWRIVSRYLEFSQFTQTPPPSWWSGGHSDTGHILLWHIFMCDTNLLVTHLYMWHGSACDTSLPVTRAWNKDCRRLQSRRDMKLGHQCKSLKGRAAIRHYTNQPTLPLLFMTFASATQFHVYLLWGQHLFSIVS